MSKTIHVVGLGPGSPERISLGVWNTLRKAAQIYLRTERHPAVQLLKDEKIAFASFDALYETKASFPEVYEAIVEHLLAEAAAGEGELVYAVTGHPAVAESTVGLLQKRCEEENVRLRIESGESFLDQLFVSLGFDPIEGFQLLDALSLKQAVLQPELHTVIAQVYDRDVASDVKLTLMERYSDDYRVTVAHALGIDGEQLIQQIPLYELDRVGGYGNLSLIYLPKASHTAAENRSFSKLEEIVRILRSPGGCPWDREQTHSSIRKNLIEETYEVLETIDDDDPEAMCEELGDLLLQVMLHSQMEAETGVFTVWDVIEGLNEKLIRRHPHVFGERSANNAEEALSTWQDMKAEEKRQKGIEPERLSVLSGVPRDLPGILKAWKLQKKASSVGFDWDKAEQAAEKVREELAELMELGEADSRQRFKEELGDLLFAVVNLSRFFQVDPEEAIALTNRKFTERFQFIEEQLRLKGKDFEQTDLEEMENFWVQAKQR